ncbi:MAG: GxxExxY protein [Planctomycetia bacterium]|nr:GxxExxY protein [Planctomycetia bacterium]
MHPKFLKADLLSKEVIGAAIEVHRIVGPGLLESIYEKCLIRELELRGHQAFSQKHASLDYKGLILTDELKFDLLIDDCLLVEVKAVEDVHPVHKAQLLSYMKLLDIPIGLLLNFHELRLIDGISRMLLRDADNPSTSQ